METGYHIDPDGRLLDGDTASGYRVDEDGIVHGPSGETDFYIEDGWLFEVTGRLLKVARQTDFCVRDGRLHGPSRTLPWDTPR